MQNQRIGILGGGSWGTAMISLFTEKGMHVNWWMRNAARIEHIHSHQHNPVYLPSAHLKTELVKISSSIEEILSESDIIIIAIPGAFVKSILNDVSKEYFRNKTIISAIKGVINNQALSPQDYFTNEFRNHDIEYFIVSGPSHAEEIVMQKLTYLTLAGNNEERLKDLSTIFSGAYTRIITTDDIDGIELASILKNAYAVSTGIIQGLGYGDNFKAVFVANCLREMRKSLKKTFNRKRDFHQSVYSGDMLVTSYSQLSRNLNLGIRIGKGYRVEDAISEMKMIAEGFYVLKNLNKIISLKKKKTPILKATYKIIFENSSPAETIKKIESQLV